MACALPMTALVLEKKSPPSDRGLATTLPRSSNSLKDAHKGSGTSESERWADVVDEDESTSASPSHRILDALDAPRLPSKLFPALFDHEAQLLATKLRTDAVAFKPAPARAIGEREVMALQSALACCQYVAAAKLSHEQVEQGASRTRCNVLIRDGANPDSIISIAQNSLHSTCSQSDSTVLLGYNWRPFQQLQDGRVGFAATLVQMDSSTSDRLCWDFLQWGSCGREGTCRWMHPTNCDYLIFELVLQRQPTSIVWSPVQVYAAPEHFSGVSEPEQEPAMPKALEQVAWSPGCFCALPLQALVPSPAQQQEPRPASLFTPASLRPVAAPTLPSEAETACSAQASDVPGAAEASEGDVAQADVARRPRARGRRGRRGGKHSASEKSESEVGSLLGACLSDDERLWSRAIPEPVPKTEPQTPADDERRWAATGVDRRRPALTLPLCEARELSPRSRSSLEAERDPSPTLVSKVNYRFACPLKNGGWFLG